MMSILCLTSVTPTEGQNIVIIMSVRISKRPKKTFEKNANFQNQHK